MIACCGLNCLECPACIATQADDDRLRADCAKLWGNQYKQVIRPEQVECDGCKSAGRHFFICRICGIRNCAVEKGQECCAHCAEFACEKITALMKISPNIKRAIEDRRRAI